MDKTNNTHLVRLYFIIIIIHLFCTESYFSPEINNHIVSYDHQWLDHFITRVKLFFKDEASLMISTSHLSDVSVALESYVGLMCKHKKHSTLVQAVLHCIKRMCIAVNE